mmetsp:Transcript_32467/g.55150  ORF Transcript_32467/g.55150 Transcript_32467/m.55150 type:complete len:96 (+) Transcript_32467:482-769(+)
MGFFIKMDDARRTGITTTTTTLLLLLLPLNIGATAIRTVPAYLQLLALFIPSMEYFSLMAFRALALCHSQGDSSIQDLPQVLHHSDSTASLSPLS